MTGTLYATITLANIEFEVTAEFDADYVDNGIGPYEYWGSRGTYHAWEWEVQHIEKPDMDCDPERNVIDAVASSHWLPWVNPFFYVDLARTMRQVEQEWADFDPDSLSDEAQDAANDMDPSDD